MKKLTKEQKRAKIEEYCMLRAKLKERAGLLTDKINKIEQEISLPLLKKKYEGKYFKYLNSCGDKKWYIYTHVKNVAWKEFTVNSFEVDIFSNHCNFSTEAKTPYTHLFEIEINENEYCGALNAFKKYHFDMFYKI